jgi:lipoate-protein ligase A
VRVIDLNYNGGTIIGSADDLSIIIVFPESIGMTPEIVINKIVEIISNYVPNTTVDGNDILVDGNKVSGSMSRTLCGSFEWAAQISFRDYSDYIAKICNKPPVKKPSFIDGNLLTRDKLEEEILAWLRKE